MAGVIARGRTMQTINTAMASSKGVGLSRVSGRFKGRTTYAVSCGGKVGISLTPAVSRLA